MKKYLIILMFFTLFSCSFDNQTGLWNQKINKIQLSNVDLNDLDDDKSFEEYKKLLSFTENIVIFLILISL